MRTKIFFATALLIGSLSAICGSAFATPQADALAMPLGTWPNPLQCLNDDAGNPTSFRLESIEVDDAPDQGNVLTRPFPDPTCPTASQTETDGTQIIGSPSHGLSRVDHADRLTQVRL